MAAGYPGHDVRFYKDKLDAAIARYGFPNGAPRSYIRDFDFLVADCLGYMQPSAPLYWQAYLYHALLAQDVFDRPDIYTITIIDQRWHFGEREWNFQPGKIEYQLRRALKGLNYLVMLEFQVFGNVRHTQQLVIDGVEQVRDHGRVIAPHVQGLLWGKPPSRRQRAQFPGGLFGAPGIKLKRITDFAGAVRYMVKPPYMGQLLRPWGDGHCSRYPWARMSLPLHHLLFRHLHQFRYPELTFGSGEGSAVLAQAKRLWRDYNLTGLRHPSYPPPPFHRISLVRRAR
jgi:hypothetical protein